MNILLNPKIEHILKQSIFPDLKNGRKDFDLNHTIAVVFWMKELLTSDPEITAAVRNKKINSKVMITAAYAHDWGYKNLFTQQSSNSLQNILDKKKLHMKRGSQMIEQLLYSRLAKDFTSQEILEVSHLVLFHDKLKKIKTETEILIMEADTLGMLDLSRVKPTFSETDKKRFLETSIFELRQPLFRHPTAIDILQKLLIEYQK